MASSPELMPPAERSVIFRSTCPVLMDDARKSFPKETLEKISRTAEQANSPGFLQPEAICSRPHCSRCLGQLFPEGFLLFRGRETVAVPVEQAAIDAAGVARGIVDQYEHLAKHKFAVITALSALNKRQLEPLIDFAFPFLARDADQLSWRNVKPNMVKAIQGLSFAPMTRERLLHRPVLLQNLIATHASRHPADFVRQLEADIEHGWDKGLCPTVSSPCFVDLTQAGFGEVIKPTKNGLHHEGTYTFMKGYALLYHQFNLYRALRNVSRGLAPLFMLLPRFPSQQATIPDPVAPPSLHEALQGALEALKPAQAALEGLLSAAISSGETLESDHNDKVTWGGWNWVADEPLGEEQNRRAAWHNITFERLAHLSILYALERDVSRCRATAKNCARKRATKAALLRDWESLELAVVLCLDHLALVLSYSLRARDAKDTSACRGGMDLLTDESGRAEVVARHQLCWAISALQNPSIHMKHKIHQLMMYLGTRRPEDRLFHGYADFVFHALAALEKLMTAMELLQPVSMREYGSEFGRSIPGYGGDVRKQHILVRRSLKDDFRDEFDKRTWAKLKLDVPGGSESSTTQHGLQYSISSSKNGDKVMSRWQSSPESSICAQKQTQVRSKTTPKTTLRTQAFHRSMLTNPQRNSKQAQPKRPWQIVNKKASTLKAHAQKSSSRPQQSGKLVQRQAEQNPPSSPTSRDHSVNSSSWTSRRNRPCSPRKSRGPRNRTEGAGTMQPRRASAAQRVLIRHKQ